MYPRPLRHTLPIVCRNLLYGLVSCLCFTGCYDDADIPQATSVPPPATTTLAELRRLYAGKMFSIESDAVVRGRVTSSDHALNFFRTLTIEQDGAAIELMAGIDGLHNIYPEGCEVTIALQGLAVGESYGVLQIGRLPEAGSGFATGYIGSRAALDSHVFRSGEPLPVRPAVCSPAELTPDMAGRLIRIDGLRYAPEGIEEGTWSGYKCFLDPDGHVIRTYTRQYADFADHEIPSCEMLLVGILQCMKEADGTPRYLLKLRDETDCWY